MKTSIGLMHHFVIIIGLFAFSPATRAPRFLAEPRSTVVEPGSYLTLSCRTDPESTTYRWSLNSTVVASTLSGSGSSGGSKKKSGFELKDGGMVLKIGPFGSHQHVGVYQCMATVPSVGTILSSEALVEEAVLHVFPPKNHQSSIKDFEMEIVVLSGNTAVLPCAVVYSRPLVIMGYEVNGRKIINDDRMQVLPSGNLQISKVIQSDEGKYTCSAYNHILDIRTTNPIVYKLVIKAPITPVQPELTVKPLERIQVIQGENLTLECAFQGWPVPHVEWEKYGGHLPGGRIVNMLGNLVISKVQRFDEGTYICRPNISSSPSFNHQHSLTFPFSASPAEAVVSVEVLEAPLFDVWPMDQSVIEGGTVAFKCRARGVPKPSIQWFYNGMQLVTGQFTAVRETSLTLSNVNRRTSGIYQCVVRNPLGSSYASALLSIRGSNPHPMDQGGTSSSSSVKQVNRQSVITSVVKEATETPVGNYDEDDGEEGDDNGYYYEEDDEVMRSTQRSRSRKKQNKSGDEDFLQEILPAPDKPEVSRSGEGSILISWKISPHFGGQGRGLERSQGKFTVPLTMFKIQSKDLLDAMPQWQTFDSDISHALRVFEINKLRAGRAYKFRVVAIYGNRANRPSPPSTEFFLEPGRRVHPNLPVPIIVEARAISTSEIFVRWQIREIDLPLVDGYHVFYSPYDDRLHEFQRVSLQTNRIQHLILSGLQPSTSYSVRVQTFGKGAESDHSDLIVKQTLASEQSINHKPPLHTPSAIKPSDQHAMEEANDDDVGDGNIDDDEEMEDERRSFSHSRSSSQLMLVGLGILLGLFLLVVVGCLVLLVWRRKNQRKNKGSIKYTTTGLLSSSNKLDPLSIFLKSNNRSNNSLLQSSLKNDISGRCNGAQNSSPDNFHLTSTYITNSTHPPCHQEREFVIPTACSTSTSSKSIQPVTTNHHQPSFPQNYWLHQQTSQPQQLNTYPQYDNQQSTGSQNISNQYCNRQQQQHSFCSAQLHNNLQLVGNNLIHPSSHGRSADEMLTRYHSPFHEKDNQTDLNSQIVNDKGQSLLPQLGSPMSDYYSKVASSFDISSNQPNPNIVINRPISDHLRSRDESATRGMICKQNGEKSEFNWFSNQQLSQRYSDSLEQNSIYSNLNSFDNIDDVGSNKRGLNTSVQYANVDFSKSHAQGSSKLVSIPLLSGNVKVSGLSEVFHDHIPRPYESRASNKRHGARRPSSKHPKIVMGQEGKQSMPDNKGEVKNAGIQKFKLLFD